MTNPSKEEREAIDPRDLKWEAIISNGVAFMLPTGVIDRKAKQRNEHHKGSST